MTARAIKLDPGRDEWPADEVVRLTADALYEFTAEPDPVVHRRKLRKFDSCGGHLRGAGQPLTSKDLEVVVRACAVVGLPEFPEVERYSRWADFIAAANDGAQDRGWWVYLHRADDPHADERQLWVKAAGSHRQVLIKLIESGDIAARFADDMVPYNLASRRTAALDRLVLERAEVAKFAAILGVVVAPDGPAQAPDHGLAADALAGSANGREAGQQTGGEPPAAATNRADDPEAQVEAASARRVEELPARIPIMTRNEEAVLVALRNAGYDPMKLPPIVNGKKCQAKQEARIASRLTKAAFDHAWKALPKARARSLEKKVELRHPRHEPRA